MLAGRRPRVQTTLITRITPMAAPVPERTQNQRQKWLSRHHLSQMLQSSPKGRTDTEQPNEGTLIIDATCAPSNIRFPQDFFTAE